MAGLVRWLRDTIDDASDVQVSLRPSPRSTGFSCETVLFDAQWQEEGRRQRGSYAARVHPSGYTLFTEHDLDRQWRLMDAVGRSGAVPVPRIVGDATDRPDYLGQPFFVMERVEGRACPDSPPYSSQGWLFDASPDLQRRVAWRSIDILARVHGLDRCQLPAEVVERGVPVGIGAQVTGYREFLSWVADGRSLPEFEDAYGWICAEVPAQPATVFCWGDARLGNILFDEDVPVAVLDWEMAGLGPPEADLAWWLIFDRIHTSGRFVPRLPGFPDETSIVDRYQRSSGRPVQDLHFYKVWAALRAAVLLFRFHDMLARRGLVSADPERSVFMPALRVLRELFEEEPPASNLRP